MPLAPLRPGLLELHSPCRAIVVLGHPGRRLAIFHQLPVAHPRGPDISWSFEAIELAIVGWLEPVYYQGGNAAACGGIPTGALGIDSEFGAGAASSAC